MHMSVLGYIPALRFQWLTRYYDGLLAATFPEKKIKQALIDQCRFRPEEHVLDFGVGTATLSLMIKQQYPSVTISGIDVDPQVLLLAARKAGSKINLVLYDGVHMGLDNAAFDKIVSSLVFHHISTTGKKQVFRELYRILKVGGELHVADFGKPAGFWARIAFPLFRRMDGEENTRVNARGLLPAFIREAGFHKVEQTVSFSTAFGTVVLLRATKA